jgi:DNA-directed RNA polymerase subunit RPC12/RpoP
MADMTFNCPQCSQGIQVDDQWAGQEIACPTCQTAVVVPAPTRHSPLVPKPPTGGAKRLSIGSSKEQVAATLKPGPPSVMRPTTRPKGPNPMIKYAKIAAILVVVAVGAYFGFGYVTKLQGKTNEARREMEKKADGGQVGHIAELNSVLDATEPGRVGTRGGTEGVPDRSLPNARAIDLAQNAAAGSPAPPPKENLPVVRPVYTLDVTQAKTPASQVNGTISGTNFVAEIARLDAAGTAMALRFIQGSPALGRR